MPDRYRVEVTREQFKFSCAHMTVFPDGTKERLHGHNYYVGVALELGDVSFANLTPFARIREATLELCLAWRERLLLAARNPFFEILRDDGDKPGGELEFRLSGQRYVLPRQDALLLPIDNVTVEALAGHIADLLTERLLPTLSGPVATGIEVSVTESRGQGARCYRGLANPT